MLGFVYFSGTLVSFTFTIKKTHYTLSKTTYPDEYTSLSLCSHSIIIRYIFECVSKHLHHRHHNKMDIESSLVDQQPVSGVCLIVVQRRVLE